MSIILNSVKSALRPTVKTSSWLLKIMIPITLAVRLMQYYGIIEWMAQYLDPVFVYLGLPGYTAIAFLTGAFVTTYAGVAVMLTMAMTLRQATIIAIMICLCHALFLESAVVRKTGSSFLRMAVIRICAAFLCGVYLNTVLPEMPETFMQSFNGGDALTLTGVLIDWVLATLKMSVMIFGLIFALMVVQRILDDLGIMYRLVKPLHPVMKFFGLPDNAAYLWLVGNVLGLSYGSAMMMDLEDTGQISREDANEVNYHLIMNHSMLEDTCVFASFGVPALWILSTRMLFALVLVWGRKGAIRFKSSLSSSTSENI